MSEKTIGGEVNEEWLKLDRQLCFSFYVMSKEIIKKYKPLLEPLGLTYTGYITMLALWEEDEVTVKSLGKRLYLDSGTLTPLLKKLEQKGYVERHRSEEDERNVYISLTGEGKKLKEDAANVPGALLEATGLKGEEARQLLKVVREYMPDRG